MDVSANTKDFPAIVRNLGGTNIIAILAVIALALGGGSLIERVITREDEIIRELSATRAEIASGLSALKTSLDAETSAAANRSALFQQTQQRQTNALIALCYSIAPNEDAANRCEDALKGE